MDSSEKTGKLLAKKDKICYTSTIEGVTSMENKQYLNEEQYQKINKKMNLIGKILLILGGTSFIICTILLFGDFISFETRGLLGPLWVFSGATAGLGLMFFMTSHQRQINAYMMQQQMPIAKEGLERMSPSMGKAAKEIAKGVKEGLKDTDEK